MAESPSALRALFLLDPSVVFLNHGSFGACPRPVFEVYQRWQRELEFQPVAFLGRRYEALLDDSRQTLAAYIGADPDGLIFVTNATEGVNLVARALPLSPGDEVLSSDHEYGAMDMLWQALCQQTGAVFVRQAVPVPVTTHEAAVEAFWAGVTPRTRVIFLSHMTSPTALILPVEPIIRRARAAGILTVIDGAHAPGQISLNVEALGADFYVGNCHKWLCGPKSAAFLCVRPEHRGALPPLLVSWGYFDAIFSRRHSWTGTRDISAYLSVAAAIQFQRDFDWEAVWSRCHQLALACRQRLQTLTGLPPLAATPDGWFGQMVSAPLPPCDTDRLKARLYDEFRIEVPLLRWQNQPLIRVSFQGYNDEADLDALLAALQQALPR